MPRLVDGACPVYRHAADGIFAREVICRRGEEFGLAGHTAKANVSPVMRCLVRRGLRIRDHAAYRVMCGVLVHERAPFSLSQPNRA